MEIVFSSPRYTDGKVIALVDVEIVEGIVVRGFRIIEGPSGLFAALPSRSFEDDGRTKWYPLVVFSSSELKERFQTELLDAYHQWNKTRGADSDSSESAPPF
jgi:stage V sporulation protein G